MERRRPTKRKKKQKMFFSCFHRVTETPSRELDSTQKALETLTLGLLFIFAARPTLVNSIKLAVYRPFIYKFQLNI